MNPYDVLGVRHGAPPEEVRRAYVRLARQHHPDLADPGRRDEAEQRMRAINEAWAVLGDADRRSTLDRQQGDDRPFRPFTPPAPDEPDPRDQPDQPYRPVTAAMTRRAGQIRMLPVILFGVSVVVAVVGMVLGGPTMLAVAGVLFILSCVSVLVVALVTMVEAAQDEG
jgi:hypothetical protein